MQEANKRKQSIIAGGLISTAGIFFAKFLGLFYAVPFNSILGGGVNVAIYGVAFNIYNYVLNICLAGIPFAIATLVAKYASRGDYQTAILQKDCINLYDCLRCFGDVVYACMCGSVCADAAAGKRRLKRCGCHE